MNCWVKRVIAVVIDCLLIGIPIGIIEMAFSLIRWIMSWLPLIHHFRFLFSTSFLFVIVYALYEAAMNYFAAGTVGKLIMGLEVEKERGGRMSGMDCLARGVLKAFCLQIWILSVISGIVMISDQHSSLHDQLLGTTVWERR